MIKLAAFDLDGTLLKSDKTLSKVSVEMMDNLRAMGIQVVIATGRPKTLIKPVLQELQIQSEVITCNGSAIFHNQTNDYIHNSVFKTSDLRNVVNLLVSLDVDFLLYEKEYIASFYDHERYLFFTESNTKLPKNIQADFRKISDEDIENLEINKVLIIEEDPEKYQVISNQLHSLNNLEITESKKEFIDVSPRGNSKGNAIQLIAESKGIKPEEILVFGDQKNDISMLQYAGIGVAMENAEDVVKDNADEVTLSNDEDGVFHKIVDLLYRGIIVKVK